MCLEYSKLLIIFGLLIMGKDIKVFINYLDKACKKTGSQTALANKLGVNKSNISQWKRMGKVPMIHCIEIERLTGVSRRKLNPTINWDYYDCV